MENRIVCLDFDGVLHSYSSGWQGAGRIPDPPVPGAMEFLANLLNLPGFEVAIFSSRSSHKDGIRAMTRWLEEHFTEYDGFSARNWQRLEAIRWPTVKPPAHMTIDDRAFAFEGTFPSMVDITPTIRHAPM
ncbi:MAG: hypothetical protein AAGH15_16740 [Myxococcota bacterium]